MLALVLGAMPAAHGQNLSVGAPAVLPAVSLSPPPAVPRASELVPQARPISADPAALPRAPAVPRELAKPEIDLAIDVKAFELAPGAPPAVVAALPALTAPFIGKARRYEDLINAVDDVTRFMQRELGWYLAYAYLPEQDPTDGVVRIAVLEGRLDQVKLIWTNDLPVRRDVVEGYLAKLKPGEVLTVADVERTVFLINDLRGINATFELEAGAQPGTASLVVRPRAEAGTLLRGDVDANGSRFLGQYRGSAQVGWNSPFGRGDGVTGNLLVSDTGGLAFLLLGYTSPMGASGLKLGATVSAVQYEIDPNAVPLGLKGDAQTYNAYGVYPVVRSRNLNLFSLLSLEGKVYNDASGGIQKSKFTNIASLGVTGDFRDAVLGGGVNTFDATWQSGQLIFRGGQPDGNTDAPKFQKWTLGFTRLQDVWTNRVLLYAAARLQLAQRNLDTTEQFRLGGPDAVRAFAPGEGTGDSGSVVTLELRMLPPESVFGRVGRESVFSLFYDRGLVRARHDPPADDPDFVNRADFSGWGVSWAWVRPGSHALRVSLAKPLRGTPNSDPVVRSPRFYAQFTKFFE